MTQTKTSTIDGFEPGKYFLGQTLEEIHRLDMQYQVLKAGFGHNDILDLPLDICKVNELNILDIGTGTGAWILDVTRIPEISARVSSTVTRHVKLFACDISDAKFPPKLLTDPLGIHFFVQDVTQPFPQEMYGTFDLIHVGLLCLALTRQGWKSALKNIHNLLKPGGLLLIMEYDLGAQPHDEAIIDNKLYNIEDYVHTKSPLVNRINSIIVYGAQRNDCVWGLCARLPAMLNSASLEIVSVKQFNLPFGAARNDSSSRDYALESRSIILDTVSKFLLSQNDLEIPRGHKITTEEKRKQVLEEIYRDTIKEGYFSRLGEWIVQKPLYR